MDVDGVLSLFDFPPSQPPAGSFAVVDGLPHWLSGQAGPLLARLARTFAPVWCTGWEERAPEQLPRLLGLGGPGYPHLTFAAPPGPGARHWKLDAIDAHAGPERPAAWIDDDHDERTAAWARGRPGPTLLVTTDPAVGLTQAHAEELEAWAAGLVGERARWQPS